MIRIIDRRRSKRLLNAIFETVGKSMGGIRQSVRVL
jgi:hypothetical protein